MPGLDRVLSHGARVVFRPELGAKLSARGNPEARDLVRHAFADVGGNGNRARSWAQARPRDGRSTRSAGYLDAYAQLAAPVLLLWAERRPLPPARDGRGGPRLLPDAQLRVLPGTGFLMAYDDPVGLARELAASASLASSHAAVA